jgi:hypothetical protein
MIILKTGMSQAPVAYVYNPSYTEGRDQESLLGLKKVIMMLPDHKSLTLFEANSMDRTCLFFISNINQEVICEELLFSQDVCSLTIVIMGS